MAKGYRTRLLEVKVIPLKPDQWEWQVCDDDTPIIVGGAHRRIGVCQDCTHFGREMCGNLPSTSPSATECLLLGVPIQPEDVGLLCVHFQPMNEHREDGHHE